MNKYNINVSNSVIGSQTIGNTDPCKGWKDADLAIVNYALPKITKLRDETTTYPDPFQNVQEWKECLNIVVDELESYNEDRNSTKLITFFKWFNHLWL